MDLQTRKLNVIGYLINLQDERVFSKIEPNIDSTRNQKDSSSGSQFVISGQKNFQIFLALPPLSEQHVLAENCLTIVKGLKNKYSSDRN